MKKPNSSTPQLAFALAAALLSTTAAEAQVVAHWRFEPGAFLQDSSGNGNTLGGTATPSGSSGFAGSGDGSASFGGNDILNTLSTLNLTAFQQLEITWQQRTTMTGIGLLFEHSANKNNSPGGFLADVNENGTGIGFPSLRTFDGNNNDNMPHATDGTWESFTLRIDLTATDPADILVVTPGSNAPGAQGANVAPFLNDTFYIGARGQGPQFFFVGNIDELKIEAVPEPTSFLLTALGAALGLGCARRRVS